MLSYLHGFHAGNHADLIKHFCLFALIERLQKKNKPFIYIDTHSGAGLYDLSSEQSQKTGEYANGVARLMNAAVTDNALQRFKQQLEPFIAQRLYPGSCYLASTMLREQDRAQLMELHPTEIQALRQNVKSPLTHIHHRDGFEGVLALSPPDIRRGLVLIDPPYEQRREYQQVAQCVISLLKKWPQAIVAIWYPILTARAAEKRGLSEKMVNELSTTLDVASLDVRLTVDDQQTDVGMVGSGMLLFNAPWQFDKDIHSGIKTLHDILSEQGKGHFHCQWLKESD
ncbi:23S rRNA (adenine(2030)-N(6))-methyltransferase RlmJ [Aestuariibacter salexigens]|uniref:23S rRNA (adenine(2030)-N(6))-methyltransferase RlmJ n=1 Tax=Aestuariibacter salexigens TaxID=226010 RepID=UPI000424B573|nr:23S rRNA (adenine(2030)-N(6))-methyltransferase RlmJ [Aestuariibacter salexigens]